MRASVLRRLALLPLLAWLAFMPVPAPCAETEQRVDPAKVDIHIEHGIALPWGAPGFRIEITGWQPHGSVVLYAIGPDGSKVALVPEKTPLQADEDGSLTLDIDYARKGLGPGHWMFLAAGKPGIHEFEAELPRVEAPTARHKKWLLRFGDPANQAQ